MSDREMIRDLVARYNADGDSGRVDGVIALFWPDASMEVGGPDAPRVHTGHDEIASIFTGAAATTFRPAGGGEAPSGQAPSGEASSGQASSGGASSGQAPSDGASRHHVRHFVATHVIDLVDDDHAKGYAYFQVLMPHGLDHWGRYFDRYERRDGEWRFAHRRVVLDGRRQR